MTTPTLGKDLIEAMMTTDTTHLTGDEKRAALRRYCHQQLSVAAFKARLACDEIIAQVNAGRHPIRDAGAQIRDAEAHLKSCARLLAALAELGPRCED